MKESNLGLKETIDCAGEADKIKALRDILSGAFSEIIVECSECGNCCIDGCEHFDSIEESDNQETFLLGEKGSCGVRDTMEVLPCNRLTPQEMFYFFKCRSMIDLLLTLVPGLEDEYKKQGRNSDKPVFDLLSAINTLVPDAGIELPEFDKGRVEYAGNGCSV